MRKLNLDDILDLRAYERTRDEYRAQIIAMKKQRRIPLGDLMTIVFENTETMRFQVQEMARIEKIIDDALIQHEIDTYNEIIPDRNELAVTLLIELTSEAQLREWLPKLVGVERSIALWLHDGTRVGARPLDEERLTRDETTAAVHFLKFTMTPEQVETFRAGGVRVVVDHEHYAVVVELTDAQHAELVRDLAAT